MAQKSVQGSSALAESIRTRRNELDLTIEEAALKAGVGTKTWSRYESGASIAHSVLDELTLYIIVEESRLLLEDDDALDDDWTEWIFDVFDDMDLITFLFSNRYLTDEHMYHFCHWTENQFYTE